MDNEKTVKVIDTSYLIKNNIEEKNKEEYDLNIFLNKKSANTQSDEDLLRFSLEEQLKELSFNNKQNE
jgi:hypothetical protein